MICDSDASIGYRTGRLRRRSVDGVYEVEWACYRNHALPAYFERVWLPSRGPDDVAGSAEIGIARDFLSEFPEPRPSCDE